MKEEIEEPQFMKDITKFMAEQVAKAYTQGVEVGSGITNIDEVVIRARDSYKQELLEKIDQYNRHEKIGIPTTSIYYKIRPEVIDDIKSLIEEE